MPGTVYKRLKKLNINNPSSLTTQLTTVTHTAPSSEDFALQDLTSTSGFGFKTKDEGNSAMKALANLQTRMSELETVLQNIGILA